MDAPLSLTYKGTCKVFSDQQTIGWILPTLAKRLRAGDPQAQKNFLILNNTPNRHLLKFNPVKKLASAALKYLRQHLMQHSAYT